MIFIIELNFELLFFYIYETAVYKYISQDANSEINIIRFVVFSIQQTKLK
jgi:hypothetical protein